MARTQAVKTAISSVEQLAARSDGLIDPEVTLGKVNLHTGGPIGLYLRWVKKRAMTIGPNIWFRDAAAQADTALLIHELVHVGQYARMGVPRFLAIYLKDMAKARFHYSHDLPLEAPAYARQARAKELLAG
jgi:hypothetical protein